MIPPEFFEKIGLYKKFHFDFTDEDPNRVDLGPRGPARLELAVGVPTAHLYCSNCAREQPFGVIGFAKNSDGLVGLPLDHVHIQHMRFQCRGCNHATIDFLVKFDVAKGYLMKVGQEPQLSIYPSPALNKALGSSSKLYIRGKSCENVGWGIGAYAYYRRLIEDNLDAIVKQIEKSLEGKELTEFQQKVKEAKQSQTTAEIIKLLAPYYPSALQMDGHNPLQTLYQALSDGLHGKTDEECLDWATLIGIALEEIFEHAAEMAKRHKRYEEAIKELAGRSSLSAGHKPSSAK